MSKVDAEFIAGQLSPHAPDTSYVHVVSLNEIEKLAYRDDLSLRLIAFCSGLIIPEKVIKALNYDCFNFHPGPPERPGYMPAPFALHEKADNYGVTFHFMLPKVDEGAIIDVTRFKIQWCQNQEEIETSAYKSLLLLVNKWSRELADLNFHFIPCGENWSGKKTTKRDLEKLLNRSNDKG